MARMHFRRDYLLKFALAGTLAAVSLSGSDPVCRCKLEHVPNEPAPGPLHDVFEYLETTHVESEIVIPAEDVFIDFTHFQEVGIGNREWTLSVIQHAAEVFVEWANKKDFELSENGRRSIDLLVVDLSKELLNDREAFSEFGLITEQAPGVMAVSGMYDPYTMGRTKIIYIGANKERSAEKRSKTIAHEMGHFLCDYFRIYDNYYQLPNGEDNMEAPAYEFGKYFALNTRY